MNHLQKILGGGFNRRPVSRSSTNIVAERRQTIIDVESSPVADIPAPPALQPLPPDRSPPIAAGPCPSPTCGCPTFYLDPYGNWACQACEPPARPSMIRSRAMVVMLSDPLFDAESPTWVDAETAIAAAQAYWQASEANAARSENDLTTAVNRQQTSAGDEPGGLVGLGAIGGLVELPGDLAAEFWAAIERERTRKLSSQSAANRPGTTAAGSAAIAAPAAASTEGARGRGGKARSSRGTKGSRSSRRGKSIF